MNYGKTLFELNKLSLNAIKVKALPSNYNQHLHVTQQLVKPRQQQQSLDSASAGDPFLLPIKKKSEKYASLVNNNNCSNSFITDFPLPNVIQSHISSPSTSLLLKTPVGKVTGYRIQATGRRGTRSSTSIVNYGRINTPATGSSYVDFAKSHYVHKKGVTGVKVWIGYSK